MRLPSLPGFGSFVVASPWVLAIGARRLDVVPPEHAMASRLVDPAVVQPAIPTRASLLALGGALARWLAFLPVWWHTRTWLVAHPA